jgi:type I restriction enzyme R subunit
MSNFDFLEGEFPELFEAAQRAENALRSDPRVACFYARFALEAAVNWVYENDHSLPARYESLGDNLHVYEFRRLMARAVWEKARLIQKIGNRAVHGNLPPTPEEAAAVGRELFHFCFWLARTYAQTKPADSLNWEDAKVPPSAAQVVRKTRAQVQELKVQLEAAQQEIDNRPPPNDEELARLRAELEAAKAAAIQTPDAHDYAEKATRDLFIDTLLREAGWNLTQARDREFPVTGMPNATRAGAVDYVLWGDDGLPLAVVEAKKTRKDANAGKQQALLYADCLETQFGRRPVIFYTNGYETYLWDDKRYPPRGVQGFLTKDELEQMIARRGLKSLAEVKIDTDIVERAYQTRAIRKYLEALDGKHRKGLFVMATGTGKTRVAIALVDALLRAGWIKRVLFLADRTALVNQTVNAFKDHLPGSSPVALRADSTDLSGAVFVATYPAMMQQIEKINESGARKFGVGHFDLVIIDEAHRSVYQKYRSIFEYFDSLLLGLTATPRAEVDHDTYSLFDLDSGEPTDAYELAQAVHDEFLTPPVLKQCDLKFPVEGVHYDELSDEEKARWDELDWGEDGTPGEVASHAVNNWFFNIDTVDKAIATLMREGMKVAGGDQLGKTIIFARNHKHAEFIVERFDKNYPHLAGRFCRVIDNQVNYAQSLIDAFSDTDKLPQIAVSVDMLDTGIDVPDVLNLVLFKTVRSKTKFWQMIGRGTRLRPNLFGEGQDKTNFLVFDFCGNFEFFKLKPDGFAGGLAKTLSQRLFERRMELLGGINGQRDAEIAALRDSLADSLHAEVAMMNVDNFVVRPQQRLVEKYEDREIWNALDAAARQEIVEHLASLPSELPTDNPEARQFDELMLRLQLAHLNVEKAALKLQKEVRAGRKPAGEIDHSTSESAGNVFAGSDGG